MGGQISVRSRPGAGATFVIELAPFQRRERPSLEQEIRRPPIDKPRTVHTQAPYGGS